MKESTIKRQEAEVSDAAKMCEALQRLKALGISEAAVNIFKKGSHIPVCTNTAEGVYVLKKQHYERIALLEQQHNMLVYFIICTNTDLGEMASFLFVSDYKEEWEQDNLDLKDGYAMTWTENVDHPQCSEFGSISFRKTASGGLERIL